LIELVANLRYPVSAKPINGIIINIGSELMTYLVSTIAARTRCIIHNVTSTIPNSEELIHVFAAFLTSWRVEVI
jgi:hypothetical protein